MVYSTSNCSRYGHPEVEAEVQDQACYGNQLIEHIDNIERCVEAGLRLTEGADMTCGWMLINIKKQPNGRLSHEEPDFRSMPIQWVRQLDRCFEHIRIQTRLAESLGIAPGELTFSRLDLAAVVGRDFLNATSFRLTREKPEQEQDSGWVFEPIPPKLDYDADASGSLLFQSLYQTALVRPEIIPFMALPIGFDVRIGEDGDLTVLRDDVAVPLQHGRNLRDYAPRRVSP